MAKELVLEKVVIKEDNANEHLLVGIFLLMFCAFFFSNALFLIIQKEIPETNQILGMLIALDLIIFSFCLVVGLGFLASYYKDRKVYWREVK